MLKKLLCLVLCLLLVCGTALTGRAEQQSAFLLLDEAMEENEDCEGADDQLAVSAKYLMQLTAMAANRLDAQGLLTDRIDAVLAAQADDEVRCRDAGQRTASRLYAAADLLALVAVQLDDGSHTGELQAILQRMNGFFLSSQDQQTAAAEAIYRLSMMIAQSLDVHGDWAAQLKSIEEAYEASAKQTRSSLHRTANSLYRTVSALSVITLQLDRSGRWQESIMNVQDNLEAMNAICVSSLHQCVNGGFRATELMAILVTELK